MTHSTAMRLSKAIPAYRLLGPDPKNEVAPARTEALHPTPGMWVLRPTFIASAWSVALMTPGSTTANRFRSSMSRIRSIRRMSSWIVSSCDG
jgi:hypothetical protein